MCERKRVSPAGIQVKGIFIHEKDRLFMRKSTRYTLKEKRSGVAH
jgi:hypothetical protein